jgi:hypothetical protein
MTVTEAFNTHYFRRSRDLNGLAVDKRLSIRALHALCTEISSRRSPLHFLGWLDAQKTERKQPWRGKRGHGKAELEELPAHRRSWSSHGASIE